jgi:pimeloyl-ACP methyl ester carboxylesterase
VQTRTVDVAGTSVCVRGWGNEGAIPFVFWHGLGLGNNGSFLEVATPALVAAGVQPIALDAPGFGDSAALERDGYGGDRLVDFLWALIDALDLARPVVLAGHSWGGTLAIVAAARRPDETAALVLLDSGHIDPADSLEGNVEATFEELIAQLEAEEIPATWDDLVEILAQEGMGQPWTIAAWRHGVDVDDSGALRVKASFETLAAARIGLMQTRATEAWPTVAAAGIPTLLLLATEPEPVRERNAAAAERMRAAFPAADLRAVEGMSHDVFVDLGAEAGAVVADWLRSTGIAGRSAD